jgi:hypothetical protein
VCHNRGVRTLSALLLLALAAPVVAQEQTTTNDQQPQVRINILNVCTPSDAEKQELTNALAHLPKGGFSQDYEIARGLSAMPDQPVATWVRIRREFPPASPYTSVQYTFSRDSEELLETLVFRIRDPKDVMQVSISDRVSGNATPSTALSANTPPDHVKVERFGKASVALARCPNADQHTYEPIFQSANEVLAHYRQLLNTRTTVVRDLPAIPTKEVSTTPSAGPKKKSAKKPAETAAPPPHHP